MKKYLVLFETGCAKYLRTHDVTEPRFHSSRRDATEYLVESEDDIPAIVEKILENNGLGYLKDTMQPLLTTRQ